MEEKGRNVVRQLCFHMDSTPIYPKWGGYGYDRRCDCLVLSLSPGSALPEKGVHPTAWAAEQGASSLPRLCSTQQVSHGLLRKRLGTMGQAGDKASLQESVPPVWKGTLWLHSHRGVSNVSLSSSVCPQFQKWPYSTLCSGNPSCRYCKAFLCHCFGAFKKRRCKSTSSLWVTWSPIRGKVYLHFDFSSEKWLMPVLQKLYKASFKLPPPAKKGVIHQRLFVSLISWIISQMELPRWPSVLQGQKRMCNIKTCLSPTNVARNIHTRNIYHNSKSLDWIKGGGFFIITSWHRVPHYNKMAICSQRPWSKLEKITRSFIHKTSNAINGSCMPKWPL